MYKKLKEDASTVDEAEAIVRNRLREAKIEWVGAYPSRNDIAAMKRKKEWERELDGIDPRLIIDKEGGRSRMS